MILICLNILRIIKEVFLIGRILLKFHSEFKISLSLFSIFSKISIWIYFCFLWNLLINNKIPKQLQWMCITVQWRAFQHLTRVYDWNGLTFQPILGLSLDTWSKKDQLDIRPQNLILNLCLNLWLAKLSHL